MYKFTSKLKKGNLKTTVRHLIIVPEETVEMEDEDAKVFLANGQIQRLVKADLLLVEYPSEPVVDPVANKEEPKGGVVEEEGDVPLIIPDGFSRFSKAQLIELAEELGCDFANDLTNSEMRAEILDYVSEANNS